MLGHHPCPPLGGATAAWVARQYVREVGTGWDGDVLESALLATSELVTNATLHGGDRSSLGVRTADGTLRIEVYDNGRTPAAWLEETGHGPGHAAAAPAEGDLGLGGRGLRIVETLSERWGVTPQPRGKVVWFEMTCGSR